jgi:endogenous inhibitor of DNA gyrase (YacG/DUF329 family)
MPRRRVLKLRCPICKKPVKADEPDFPFCSDRCRSIDLGKWATGAYVIPSTETEDAEDAIPFVNPDDPEENS